MSCGCLDFSNRVLKVIKCATTARATDELSLAHPKACSLEYTERGFRNLIGREVGIIQAESIPPSVQQDAPTVGCRIESKEIKVWSAIGTLEQNGVLYPRAA